MPPALTRRAKLPICFASCLPRFPKSRYFCPKSPCVPPAGHSHAICRSPVDLVLVFWATQVRPSRASHRCPFPARKWEKLSTDVRSCLSRCTRLECSACRPVRVRCAPIPTRRDASVRDLFHSARQTRWRASFERGSGFGTAVAVAMCAPRHDTRCKDTPPSYRATFEGYGIPGRH